MDAIDRVYVDPTDSLVEGDNVLVREPTNGNDESKAPRVTSSYQQLLDSLNKQPKSLSTPTTYTYGSDKTIANRRSGTNANAIPEEDAERHDEKRGSSLMISITIDDVDNRSSPKTRQSSRSARKSYTKAAERTLAYSPSVKTSTRRKKTTTKKPSMTVDVMRSQSTQDKSVSGGVSARRMSIPRAGALRRLKSESALSGKFEDAPVVDTSIFKNPFMKTYDAKAENAALTIQRMWRLHHMKHHFMRIKTNLEEFRKSTALLSTTGYPIGNSHGRGSHLSTSDISGSQHSGDFFSLGRNIDTTSRNQRRATFDSPSPPSALLSVVPGRKQPEQNLIAPTVPSLELNYQTSTYQSPAIGTAPLTTSLINISTDAAPVLRRRKSLADRLTTSESVNSLAELAEGNLNVELDSGRSNLNAHEEIIRNCITEFNISPKKGVSQFIFYKVTEEDPAKVAELLFHEPRLDKTHLGEYLGMGDPFQIAVLGNFVSLFDFTGQDFDSALRKLLTKFRLPGEAQKIDRIMNNFSAQYCTNNPEVFTTADTGYILSYSLIMLNTDQHSPHVKVKMSLHDFIRNNRGIDSGHDLPEEMLRRLYFSIVSNEIKMKEDDNVARINMICSHIHGKLELWENPDRRHVGDFFAQQVPDLSKPNYHKHERMIFLFNDAIIFTKPKLNKRFQFRYLFNLIKLVATSKRSTELHRNVVELSNIHGTLITLSFITPEERDVFMRNIAGVISEVEATQQALLKEMQRRTAERALVAKKKLETAYSAGGPGRFRQMGGTLRAARALIKEQAYELLAKKREPLTRPASASLPPRPSTPSSVSESEGIEPSLPTAASNYNEENNNNSGNYILDEQGRAAGSHRRRNTVTGVVAMSTGSLSQVRETFRRAARDVFA